MLIIIIKVALVVNTDTVPWSERWIDFIVQYLFRETYDWGNGHSGKYLADEMVIWGTVRSVK